MKLHIKEAREAIGLTQEQFAEMCGGYTHKAVSTWENGMREPKYEVLCKIADICGVTVDYLLGREPKADGEPITVITKPDLTDDEADILRIYRLLDRRAQHELMIHMYGLEDGVQK